MLDIESGIVLLAPWRALLGVTQTALLTGPSFFVRTVTLTYGTTPLCFPPLSSKKSCRFQARRNQLPDHRRLVGAVRRAEGLEPFVHLGGDCRCNDLFFLHSSPSTVSSHRSRPPNTKQGPFSGPQPRSEGCFFTDAYSAMINNSRYVGQRCGSINLVCRHQLQTPLPGLLPGLNSGKMQLSRILDPASCGVITREHGRMPDYGARLEAKRMTLDQKSPRGHTRPSGSRLPVEPILVALVSCRCPQVLAVASYFVRRLLVEPWRFAISEGNSPNF